MSDFSFLHDSSVNSWIVSAPRRAKRPNAAKETIIVCPFCPENSNSEKSLYEVAGDGSILSEAQLEKTESENHPWMIKVIKNKYPFAPIHELIILSPDHVKNYDLLPFHQIELILQTYQQRFQVHQSYGQVYIFHNHGQKAGESLPHPHTQLVVIPPEVSLPIHPPLVVASLPLHHSQETDHFFIHCPRLSQWPDEVWVSPKQKNKLFAEASRESLNDLAFILSRLIKIFKLRHGDDYPYNFYIYPKENWYLRLIPRQKTIGGFEVGTGVFVNTQDPLETIAFIREHFMTPDEDKIRQEHQAEYHRAV